MDFIRCIFFLFPFVGFSQSILPEKYDTTSYSHEFTMNGSAEIGATGIPSSILNRFVFGGNISQNDIDEAVFFHAKSNRLGSDVHGKIEYRNLERSIRGTKYGFMVRAAYYNYSSVSYGKDAFELFFKGNSAFVGRKADFSGLEGMNIAFQKVGFGLINKKSKSNISFNLYGVSNYSNLFIQDGSIYQSSDSSNLDLVLNGRFKSTFNSSMINGVGLGVDMDFIIPINWNDGRSAFLRFQIENLGASYMLGGLNRVAVDTSISFNGFKFKDLIGDDSPFDGTYSITDSLGVKQDTLHNWLILPGFIQVGKIVDENYKGKLQSFFGLKIYPTLAYTPQLYLGFQWKPKERFTGGMIGYYGGFTNLKAGAYLNLNYRQWSIGIAGENVFGSLHRKGNGTSLMTQFRWRI